MLRILDGRIGLRTRAPLDLPDLGKLAPKDRESILLILSQIAEFYVVEQYLQGVANAAELASITANLVEHPLFDFWMWSLPEIDIDEAELRALLIERPGIDGLPQAIGCERHLETSVHGLSPFCLSRGRLATRPRERDHEWTSNFLSRLPEAPLRPCRLDLSAG